MSEPSSQHLPHPDSPEAVSSSLPPTETRVQPQPKGARLPRTRTGAAYASLITGVILLVLLLVFILENTQSVKVSYFGAGGHLPLGVALLVAAVGGALLVGVVGTARILRSDSTPSGAGCEAGAPWIARSRSEKRVQTDDRRARRPAPAASAPAPPRGGFARPALLSTPG